MEEALRRLVREPLGVGDLEPADVEVLREDPVCGDRLRMKARFEGGRCAALRWRAEACPATLAAASLAVREYEGRELESGPPFGRLRGAVASLGGLGGTGAHALALVEACLEVLARNGGKREA